MQPKSKCSTFIDLARRNKTSKLKDLITVAMKIDYNINKNYSSALLIILSLAIL